MLRCKLSSNKVTMLALSAILAAAISVAIIPDAHAWWDFCINVTKSCDSATVPGEYIIFYGAVSNCSENWELLDVTVVDDKTGIVLGPITLPPQGVATFSGSYDPAVCDTPSKNTVTAYGTYLDIRDGEYYTISATDYAICQAPCDGDGEGCTPGYWKNHIEMWLATGLSPSDDFDTTFGLDLFDPDITLDQAVHMGGGGVRKLARHGTAALLSALHPEVNYPISSAEVITAVQSGNAEILSAYNELGCPID